MSQTWSQAENQAIVQAYLDMLENELEGNKYVKSAVRRELREGPLQKRTDASVEMKFQNLSKAMKDIEAPWVEGYKPLGNLQGELREAVEDALSRNAYFSGRSMLSFVTSSFADNVVDAGIHFGANHEEFVRTFVASLATKRFVILTGLSGSGKTQIALKFGEWLGAGRFAIIPVRPDWTGAEALFGYEDALAPVVNGRRGWAVPQALKFMLRAHEDPDHPHLLLLDEMNLAHVERYFADALSGMESKEAVLPNLAPSEDGVYRLREGAPPHIPIPENLLIVGTVNIDETTYMFSPKVLDRANTIEFRVSAEDLNPQSRTPTACQPGQLSLVQGFLTVAKDEGWHLRQEVDLSEFPIRMKDLHRILARANFEFGHRVFHEAMRFATIFHHAGNPSPKAALDRQVMQKILPRLHGARRHLEPTLCALAHYCFDFNTGQDKVFDPLAFEPRDAKLPISFEKLHRMTRILRANQFVSFTE